jgi:hypothetical protein
MRSETWQVAEVKFTSPCHRDMFFNTCLQATPPCCLGGLTSQLRRADTSTTPASYLRHTSHRVDHDTNPHKVHLVTMAHMLNQAHTIHDKSTYSQTACDRDQRCAEIFNNMQNQIEARKREVADIDEIFLQHWPQHSVDVRGANEGLMVLLSVILFRWVMCMALIRLGASRPIAFVLAVSLIPPRRDGN